MHAGADTLVLVSTLYIGTNTSLSGNRSGGLVWRGSAPLEGSFSVRCGGKAATTGRTRVARGPQAPATPAGERSPERLRLSEVPPHCEM